MFSLVAGALQWLLQRREVRVLLVGLDGSGKSSLALRLKQLSEGSPNINARPTEDAASELPAVRPTSGFQVSRLCGRCSSGRSVSVLLWEVGGAAPLRAIWNCYATDADISVFCVDASTPDRLEEAGAAFASLMIKTQETANRAVSPTTDTDRRATAEVPPWPRVIVLATKQDASGALCPETVLENLLRFAAHHERALQASESDASALLQRLRRRVVAVEGVSAKDFRSVQLALQAAIDAALNQQLLKTELAAQLVKSATANQTAVSTSPPANSKPPKKMGERNVCREENATELEAPAVCTPGSDAPPESQVQEAQKAEAERERERRMEKEMKREKVNLEPLSGSRMQPDRARRRVLYEVDLSVGALNALLWSQQNATAGIPPS